MLYHVSIYDENRGRDGVLLVDQPVLVQVVQLLQVVQRDPGFLPSVPLL